jgi:hypothetical protein
MPRWVHERSRSSSPSQLWLWRIVVIIWCNYLAILYRTSLYNIDVTFIYVPWVIICVIHEPSTHLISTGFSLKSGCDTTTRTRQAFQTWPNLKINIYICVLCSVLCDVFLSCLLLILALQYLLMVLDVFEVQDIFETWTSFLLQPTQSVFHSTTIHSSSTVRFSNFEW